MVPGEGYDKLPPDETERKMYTSYRSVLLLIWKIIEQLIQLLRNKAGEDSTRNEKTTNPTANVPMKRKQQAVHDPPEGDDQDQDIQEDDGLNENSPEEEAPADDHNNTRKGPPNIHTNPKDPEKMETEPEQPNLTEMEITPTERTEDKETDKDTSHSLEEINQGGQHNPEISIKGKPPEETTKMIEQDAPKEKESHYRPRSRQTKGRKLQKYEQPKHGKRTSPRAGHTTFTSNNNDRKPYQGEESKWKNRTSMMNPNTEVRKMDTLKRTKQGNKGMDLPLTKERRKLAAQSLKMWCPWSAPEEATGSASGKATSARSNDHENNVEDNAVSTHESYTSREEGKRGTNQNGPHIVSIIIMTPVPRKPIIGTQCRLCIETKMSLATVAVPTNRDDQQDAAGRCSPTWAPSHKSHPVIHRCHTKPVPQKEIMSITHDLTQAYGDGTQLMAPHHTVGAPMRPTTLHLPPEAENVANPVIRIGGRLGRKGRPEACWEVILTL